jgi:ribonuclease HI
VKELTIYTDGACSGNPGPGGWGSILIYKSFVKELSGACADTTNNRMELTAAIEALNILKGPCKVRLYSDSAYLCRAFNENWIRSWTKNNWKTSSGKPVENRDLWERLIELTGEHDVSFIKVKGHSDNENNNRCDKLAREAIKALISK